MAGLLRPLPGGSASGLFVPKPCRARDLPRFAGLYAWPHRQIEVTATADGLLISNEDGQTEALPLDGRTFLTGPEDPDNPAVTFGAFDTTGRPGVIYEVLWGLPRVRG